MIYIPLLIVIAFLCGLFAWQEHQNRQERNKLVNALMSRNAEQFRDLETIEKLKLQVKQPVTQQTPPDFVDTSTVDDEALIKAIENNG